MASIQNYNLRNENDFKMQNITFELIFKLTLVLIFFEFLFFHHKLKLNRNTIFTSSYIVAFAPCTSAIFKLEFLLKKNVGIEILYFSNYIKY